MKPLIFVPGIKATALVDTNTFDFQPVWDAYDTRRRALRTALAGEYMDEKLHRDARFDEARLSIIERGAIASMPYEGPIARLIRKLGERYENESPIYLFGYDWRMSNMENGRRLKTFVDYIGEKLEADGETVQGFRFLTHSMGGLVFSCFLRELGGDFSRIDKAVLCAPPLRGSVDALVEMVEGDGFLDRLRATLLRRDLELRKVVRTYPSVFELLPWYDGAIRRAENFDPLSMLALGHWQKSIYDDDELLFQDRLAGLDRFRSRGMQSFAELPVPNRNRIIVIAGEGAETRQSIRVARKQRGVENFVLLDEIETSDAGDGTVPLTSSTVFAGRVRTLAVQRPPLRLRELRDASSHVSFHGLFLEDSHVQNIVQRFLTTDLVTPRIPGDDPWWQSLGHRVREVTEPVDGGS